MNIVLKAMIRSYIRRKRIVDITNDPPIVLFTLIKSFITIFRKSNSVNSYVENYFSSEKVFFTKTGRLAIYLFLKGIKIEPGDEVIVAALNCFTVPEPVIIAGGTPVYVDVDNRAGLSLEKIVEKVTNNTKCVIIPIFDGIDINLDPLLDFCCLNKIPVLVDCAHTLRYQSGHTPLAGDFRVAGVIHSFSLSKMFSLMGGGLLLVKDGEISNEIDIQSKVLATPQIFSEAVSILNLVLNRLFGRIAFADLFSKIFRKINSIPEIEREEYLGKPSKGYFTKMSRYKQLLLIENLKYHDNWMAIRRDYCKTYMQELQGLNIKFLINDVDKSSPLHFPILVESDSANLHLYLISKNIYPDRMFFPQISPEGFDNNIYKYQESFYPQANSISKKILNLPISPRLNKEDILSVCDAIKEYYNTIIKA
jgi:dTDP-4-amino-4,6-dideoxygalactose transaminase